MGSKTTMVSSKHSSCLIEAWLPVFLIRKNLESMSQRANSEEEMKYHSICPSSLGFLSLMRVASVGYWLIFLNPTPLTRKSMENYHRFWHYVVSVAMFNVVIFFFSKHNSTYFYTVFPCKKYTPTLML